MKIDFESLSIKLKNNKFIIGSEIKEIFYFSENIGKPLNKKYYLIFRLYTAIVA
jgi:hypothetical protein